MQISGRQIPVWRSGVKVACESKEQYKGIDDIVNDQGFAMHYRAIPNLEVSDVRESIQQVTIMATKPEFLVAKKELFVAL